MSSSCRAAHGPTGAVWLALLLWGLQGVEGKWERGTVRLGGGSTGESRFQYIGKFGYGLGDGALEVSVGLRAPGEPAHVELDLVLDEDWPQFVALEPCSPAARVLSRKHLELTAEHSMGAQRKAVLSHRVRPHIWYFGLSRCAAEGDATVGVDYVLHLQQDGGSELSLELRHMFCATVLAVLCLSGFLVHFSLQCRRFQRGCGAGKLHPVIRVLAGAVLLQWAAQVLLLLHLLFYRQTGVGASGLAACADVLFMLSQVLSSALLLVIARGYTLLGSRHEELTSARPTLAAMALLHVALVSCDKLLGDRFDKHHDNAGAVGWGILAVRMLLWAWFIFGIRGLRRQSDSPRLHDFLRRFQLAGSLYFLAYPAIYLTTKAFAEYLQHPVMHVGLVAMQAGASLWLSRMFLLRGHFQEISALGAPLLPAGFGYSCGKQA
jgi:hypothetical protein